MWNHRYLYHEHETEPFIQLHDVYYDENGVPNGYSERSSSIYGENLDEIKWNLDSMRKAIDKPILYAGSKFPKEYTNSKKIETIK